jgi:nucleoside recognition membrane protein YjiH
MAIIKGFALIEKLKDPEWYYSNQNTKAKILSNLIFLGISIYYTYKERYDLSIVFLFLFCGSTLFHLKPSRTTLFIDRLAMVLVFSKFFNLFYPQISFTTFSIIGIITTIIWYKTEELLWYFLYQLVGILLFLVNYPMNFMYKAIISTLYILITYSQMIEKGKYHALKHLGLGALSLLIVQ